MSQLTIDEIYNENANIREKLKATIAGLTDEEADLRQADDQWSIAQIVEHVSLVDEKMALICSRLLEKARAEGETGDGTVEISGAFEEKARDLVNAKLSAPEVVLPAGLTIGESLARLEESQKAMEAIRPAFRTLDGRKHKFPHPYFGDITAQEWLALRGGHEARHLKQIRTILKSSKK